MLENYYMYLSKCDLSRENVHYRISVRTANALHLPLISRSRTVGGPSNGCHYRFMRSSV